MDLLHTIKLKEEENKKHCEKLRSEIQRIKQERVDLIKKMKSETEQSRKNKKNATKEVNQLKEVERKRKVEISKLQEGNNRQENILRRKNEEITRIQKQLQETSVKLQEATTNRYKGRDASKKAEWLRGWMTQQIELSVGLAEGKINLNRLMQERKELAAEFTKLSNKLDGTIMDDEASEKRNKVSYDIENIASVSANQCSSGTAKLKQLQNEIDCKTAQINQIQQILIKGDQGEICFFGFKYRFVRKSLI